MSESLESKPGRAQRGGPAFRPRKLLLWIPLAFLAWLAIQAGLILRYALPSNTPGAEVAVVLGAAVIDDKPSPVFAARLDHAIDLYERDLVEKLIFTGGYGEGDSRSESEVGASYAKERGVPAEHIAIEVVSRTTKGNLLEARRLMIERGWKTCVIVSDPLHMRRAMTMAANLHMDAKASPTQTSAYRSFSKQFGFLLRELYFQHHYWVFGE